MRSILNVGSFFRTADAAGVGHIWLTGYTPGPDTHPERIAKTALGAEAMVPWSRMKRVGDVIARLRREGVQVLALEQTKSSIDYRACSPKFPIAMIVGNEVDGVGVAARKADVIIEIPMRGTKESLNVSVALGVALYELTRGWE